MKTLHLNLKRRWFDMILSGEKKEEYREIKPYWWTRLVQCGEWDERKIIMSKYYDTITFKNGYAKNSPTMIVEYTGLRIGAGIEEWGAPQESVFALCLGKIIETKNIKTK